MFLLQQMCLVRLVRFAGLYRYGLHADAALPWYLSSDFAQLIPQIIINYRRHHTTGLQPSMMLLWASAGVPLGVYNIVENFNIALRIQPQILTFLSLLTWSQCYHYGRGWSVAKCAIILIGMCTLMGSIEAGLIFALRVGTCTATRISLSS